MSTPALQHHALLQPVLRTDFAHTETDRAGDSLCFKLVQMLENKQQLNTNPAQESMLTNARVHSSHACGEHRRNLTARPACSQGLHSHVESLGLVSSLSLSLPRLEGERRMIYCCSTAATPLGKVSMDGVQPEKGGVRKVLTVKTFM